MKKLLKIFSTYLLPVIIIGLVVGSCIVFLLDNLPYDHNAIDVSMDREKIVISNNYLMSDELGKQITMDNQIGGTTGYVDFNVQSKVDGKVKYEVVLVREQSDPEIDTKFVKVYLTDSNDKAYEKFNLTNLPSYYDLRVSETDPSGRVLYSGYLTKKGSQSFRLRLWTADTHEIVTENKIFAVKLKVNVK